MNNSLSDRLEGADVATGTARIFMIYLTTVLSRVGVSTDGVWIAEWIY